MDIINIVDIIKIIRKYFTKIVAICIFVGIASYYIVTQIQTYTCSLNFKYTYSAANQGLAPNETDELDPYEIKSPTVIKGAIDQLIYDEDTLSVEGIRNNMTVSEIITSQDNEIRESAAVLGEKYSVIPTEYELEYTYSAKLGDEFGAKLFDKIISSYDQYIIHKYYNKKYIPDFMKAINQTDVDYLDKADIISQNLNSIISSLDDMAGAYPEYRSKRNGYSFSELSYLYQNIRDIQYAKFYGNIRAGNLSKDREMVIKNYSAKVKELSNEQKTNGDIAEHYKREITSFYEPYKRSGLYDQANKIQNGVDATNSSNEPIFRDWEGDPDKLINTYDDIVLRYTEKATESANNLRQIDYYNNIIFSFLDDTVSEDTKQRLISKNEIIIKDLSELSAQYAILANNIIDEYMDNKVSGDLQYLISTDVSADKPVKIITMFLVIVFGGILLIAFVFYEVVKKHYKEIEKKDLKKYKDKFHFEIKEEQLDEEYKAAYEQYMNGFKEMYLEYQPMINTKTNEAENFEAFIRWDSRKIGIVSPNTIIEYFTELNLVTYLNEWIIETVCKDITKINQAIKKKIVVHINCNSTDVINFGLNEIIMRNIHKYHTDPKSICLEIHGHDIIECLEDIITLSNMGIRICIDRFEDKEQENEIIEVLEPDYVKIFSRVFMQETKASSSDEILAMENKMMKYMSEINWKCWKKDIKVCICGIDTKNQDQMANIIGCHYKQGYYYMRPMRLEDILSKLSDKKYV